MQMILICKTVHPSESKREPDALKYELEIAAQSHTKTSL